MFHTCIFKGYFNLPTIWMLLIALWSVCISMLGKLSAILALMILSIIASFVLCSICLCGYGPISSKFTIFMLTSENNWINLLSKSV